MIVTGTTTRVYLDHAATTPVDPAVLDAMTSAYRDHFGNASSLHGDGRAAKQVLEASRATIASCMGVEPGEIVFTGSGTESDNMAIQGTAFKMRKLGKGDRIVTSTIEHPAVRSTCAFLQQEFGFKVTEVPVDEHGIISLDALQEAVVPGTVLVTIMHANNEIGTIQPVKVIGEIAADRGAIFHTDAVQAFGKIPVSPDTGGFQLLSASAHKIHGPKGVGLLYVKGGGTIKGTGKYIQPIIHGGGHERGMRPATENIPGIVGFAKATELAFQDMDTEMERQASLRDHAIRRITDEIEATVLNGHPTLRLPNNINASIQAVEGESLLLRLDMAGYSCSTGSACSSKNLKASHVLLAIGRDPEVAHGSLRVTLGKGTTREQLDGFVDTLTGIVSVLRKMSPLWHPR